MSNPPTVLRSLYSRLGLAYTAEVERAVHQHTHGRQETFYSTFRREDFDHNSWRNKSGLEEIRRIGMSMVGG